MEQRLEHKYFIERKDQINYIKPKPKGYGIKPIYFDGYALYGADISQIPYKRTRKSLSLLQYHCKQRPLLYVPIELPDNFDGLWILCVCEKCGKVWGRYPGPDYI